MGEGMAAFYGGVAAVIGGIVVTIVARQRHGWLAISGVLCLLGAFGAGYWLADMEASPLIWFASVAFLIAGGVEFVHRLLRILIELDMRRVADRDAEQGSRGADGAE